MHAHANLLGIEHCHRKAYKEVAALEGATENLKVFIKQLKLTIYVRIFHSMIIVNEEFGIFSKGCDNLLEFFAKPLPKIRKIKNRHLY